MLFFVHGDATAALPNEQFDTVVMLDVLEHIEDDVKMMKSLADRLIRRTLGFESAGDIEAL